jgi:hypothetical protein
MNPLRCDQDIYSVRHGLYRIYAHRHVSADAVVNALHAGKSTVLKSGPKAEIRFVSGWVVKESRGPLISRFARHSFRKQRYRSAWIAAHFLRARGIYVPEPLAYLEKSIAGLSTGNALFTVYLEGFANVEVYMKRLAEGGAEHRSIADFLAGLAESVNRLNATGAWHQDLSGKNIFTRTGQEFCFIDLDAVRIDDVYSDESRMKNHVQLYDSFCDVLSDALLYPFIQRMLPENIEPRIWMPAVRKGQRERRRLILEKWEKQGRTESGG